MLEVMAILAVAAALKGAVFIPYLLQSQRKPLVETDLDHAWSTAWQMPEMMRKMQGDIKAMAANTAVPEVLLTNSFGLVSAIGSDGVLRTERAMSPVSDETPVVGGPPVGKVIPLFGRMGDE